MLKSFCCTRGIQMLTGILCLIRQPYLGRGPRAPSTANILFSHSCSLSPEERGLCFLNVLLPNGG